MKVLIVLSALAACAVAKPGYAYAGVSPLAYGGYYGHIGAPILGAPAFSTYAAAPAISTYAAAPAISTYAAAPAISYAAAPAVGAPAIRTIAAAPAISTYAAAPAISYAAAPAVIPAPTIKTQYHAQDELGQATYGHNEPFQAHHAIQDALGNKIGSYSYLNPTDGKIHRTDYVADGLGFRVAANDLPAAPIVEPIPVVDTPEVVAAKAAHFAAHAAPLEVIPLPETPEVVAAKAAHLAAHAAPLLPIADTPEVAAAKAEHLAAISRARRSVVLAHTPAATAPLVHAPVAPLAYAAPVAPLAYAAHVAPLAYSAPAVAPLAYSAPIVAPHPIAAPLVRDATLTTIVNNPGHAISYRVD